MYMNIAELIARFSSCTFDNKCFISLQSLEGQPTAQIMHPRLGHEVIVLAKYVS